MSEKGGLFLEKKRRERTSIPFQKGGLSGERGEKPEYLIVRLGGGKTPIGDQKKRKTECRTKGQAVYALRWEKQQEGEERIDTCSYQTGCQLKGVILMKKEDVHQCRGKLALYGSKRGGERWR